MSAENRKHGFGKYSGDYTADLAGNFTYTGPRFRVELLPEQSKKLSIGLSVCTALIAASFVTAGFSNGFAARTLFAVIPMICCFLPEFYLVMGLFSFLFRKEELTRQRRDESVVRMKRSAVGVAAFSAIALVGGIIACFMWGAVQSEITFLAGNAVMFASALTARALVSRIKVTEIEKKQNGTV